MTIKQKDSKRKSKFVEKYYLDENTEEFECTSSMIKTVWYNPNLKVMRIQFNSDKIYEYKKIPEKYWKRLKISKSPGKFFNKYIKENYKGQLIDKDS